MNILYGKKNYTQEEKIDFIFNYLQSQQRAQNMKFIFKLLILCFFLGGIYYIYNLILTQNISQVVSQKVLPIVSNKISQLGSGILEQFKQKMNTELDSQMSSISNKISVQLEKNLEEKINKAIEKR